MIFKNLNSNFQKPASIDTLKWMMGWHHEKRPKSPSTGVPIPFEHNNGKLLASNAIDTLTWIGQASFLIQLGNKNFLIDPVMSSSLGFIKRNSPPGLSWEILPKIDIVFITHNHRDHMDAYTLKRLGNDPIYIVPQGLKKWFIKNHLNKVIEMKWWQNIQVEGLDITFVPSEHWSRRNLTDINTSWWGGYIISGNGKTLYHSGDSGWFEGFDQIAKKFKGKIDVAMLPTGAYAPRWFMSPQHISPSEAIKYFQMLEAKHFVAMHWGTFKLSDEPLDEPLYLLPKLWEKAGLPAEKLTCGILGKTWQLDEWTRL